MPPSCGPLHGDTSATSTETSSSCKPDAVKSRPLVVTSTLTTPAADAVLLHTTASSLSRAARTSVPLKRQCR